MRHVHEIEKVFKKGQAHLEIVCGPMFSGKTEELIRRIRRVHYAKQKAIVFKPEIDNRYSIDEVVSHSNQAIDSLPMANSHAIKAFLESKKYDYHVVGIDEVQFFDQDIVEIALEMVEKGIRVIAVGLSEDYMCKPFGPMPRLLAHADVVTKLWAICMNCGSPASKTQRIVKKNDEISKDQVLVGSADFYEARCRQCYQNGAR